MAWLAAVMPIVGGAIGAFASEGDRKKAAKAMDQAKFEIDQIGAPPDLSKEIFLEKFRQVGILTPEMEQGITLGFSKVAQIQEDQQLKDVQRGALESLTQRGKVGLTPEDRLALSDIRQQASQQAEAKRQQIIQSLQARGMGGAGSELAASLQASQGGADTASREGMQVGATASQNALAAMSQAGQLGGSIAQAEFGREFQKGSAADAISQFNVANQIAQQTRNIGAKNQAQESNLNTAQSIANQNVAQANEESRRQAEAQRQYWEDQVNRSKLRSGAEADFSKHKSEAADATQKQYSSMGSSTGSGMSAMSGGGKK